MEDVVKKDFDRTDAPACDFGRTDPCRLRVPSDISLPDIEEMEMAEGCLHARAEFEFISERTDRGPKVCHLQHASDEPADCHWRVST